MNRTRKQIKKNNKRSQRPRKRMPVARIPAMYPHLSKCAVSYAQALTNPFASFDELPCIPDTITVPSTKFASRCRGMFHAGTTGTGWVVVDPFRMLISNPDVKPHGTGWITTYPVVFTTPVYTAGTYTWTTTSTGPFYNSIGEVARAQSNSPYPQNKFWQAAIGGAQTSEFRLVGAGLRVRYTGTELNRGGRMTLVYSPSATTIPVGQFTSDLLISDRVRTFPVKREWEAITYRPEKTEYLDYSDWGELGGPSDGFQDGDDFLFPNTTSPVSLTDHYCLLAMCDGAEPGVSFEFEVIAHFEALLLPDPTSSHCDPVGFGAIMSSLPALPNANAGTSFRQAISGALNSLKTTTSGLLQSVNAGQVGRVAGGALRGFLQGGLGGAALNAGLATMPLIEDID